MKVLGRHPRAPKRQGSAIIAAVIAVTLIAGLAGATLSFSVASKNEVESARHGMRALYMAEAGVSESLVLLSASETKGVSFRDNLEVLGTEAAPVARKGGSYWAELVEGDDETFIATAHGEANGRARSVEAVIARLGGGPFDHALFAGNESKDPQYELRLSGDDDQGDEVKGDVYSAGDVSIEGDAEVDGEIRAGGDVYGADGDEGVLQPVPDIGAMNYEVNNDYDVASMFDDDAFWRQDNAGGYGWQMPESSPAHIFRKHPTDRRTEKDGTEKDDYFLEDPYEAVNSDSDQDGSDAFLLTLSGAQGKPGPNGSDKVYFIDGNLWIHNKKSYSLKLFNAGADGARITFVVKGNVYFSDNVFLGDDETDGIAFIAINDDDVDDSGNIYFGDPVYGTLVEMNAFMYAENNFFDNNLDEDGSAEVTVNGNMSAGNHVDIQRDFVDANGDVVHSKLIVNWDDRLTSGDLALPGIPGAGGGVGFQVVAWREVARN